MEVEEGPKLGAINIGESSEIEPSWGINLI